MAITINTQLVATLGPVKQEIVTLSAGSTNTDTFTSNLSNPLYGYAWASNDAAGPLTSSGTYVTFSNRTVSVFTPSANNDTTIVIYGY